MEILKRLRPKAGIGVIFVLLVVGLFSAFAVLNTSGYANSSKAEEYSLNYGQKFFPAQSNFINSQCKKYDTDGDGNVRCTLSVPKVTYINEVIALDVTKTPSIVTLECPSGWFLQLETTCTLVNSFSDFSGTGDSK